MFTLTDVPENVLHSILTYVDMDVNTTTHVILRYVSLFRTFHLSKKRTIYMKDFMKTATVELLKWAQAQSATEFEWDSEVMDNINSIECMKYAIDECGFIPTHYTMDTIASNGNLELMKYLHERYGYRFENNMNTCRFATMYGHVECLQYAHEHGCPWDEQVCWKAAFNGHIDCLKYAHQNGCPWDVYTIRCAAESGHIECLKYAFDNGCSQSKFGEDKLPRDVMTSACAAANGHLECLMYLHENGYPWDAVTCSSAAYNGNVECLKYAYENGCPWNANTIRFARVMRYDDCVEYARSRGCPE